MRSLSGPGPTEVLRPPGPPARPLIKICGLRTLADLAAAEGADLVGVVTGVPGSPRNRALPEARALFVRAEGSCRTVAVVVRPSAETIRHVLAEAAPDLVQVHGPLPPGLAPAERARLVPSLAIPSAGGSLTPPPVPPEGPFPFVHLDSAGGPLPGGTGRVSDWELCKRIVHGYPSVRFLLAGGLTPENILGALVKVQPSGVDVSSGVESRPGEKSRAKVERLLRAVEAYHEARIEAARREQRTGR